MAKLGGVRFGAPPPAPRPEATQPDAAPATRKEETQPEEEDEQARKERIRAKLAGMGGMRFGMFPPSAPPPASSKHAPVRQEEEAEEAPPPPPSRAPRAPVPPPPVESEEEDLQVEEEEEAPPPLPVGRHPVPPPVLREQDEPLSQSIELVDAEDVGDAEEEVEYDEPTPLPPPRPSHAPLARAAPAPPPPPQRGDSQWELPEIHTGGSLGMHQPGEASPSQWSDDSTAYPPAPPMKVTISQAAPPSPSISDMQLSADELAGLSERVGRHVLLAATELAEQSKKTIVGDGSYAGFLNAVLAEVPQAEPPSGRPLGYGYLVYAQAGGTVQRRVADVLPGDVITLYDADLKGHKGLQKYHQHVGAQEPCVGVVSEVEAKKFKIRALHANQHVSQQAVESVSYRLEDLKSGQVKVRWIVPILHYQPQPHTDIPHSGAGNVKDS
jgi:hypothetical protein